MRIPVRKFAILFSIIVIGLILAGGLVPALKNVVGWDWIPDRLMMLFHLDYESNLPTYYSIITLFFSSYLLSVIYLAKRRENDRMAKYWLGLAIIFLLLSLDEAASIHEMSIDPVRNALGTSGIFFFAWVIPALILLAVFAVVYLRFLFVLPRWTRIRFILAGLIFVSGAVVMEMVAGVLYQYREISKIPYALGAILEEGMEMAGILIFMVTLLKYIKEEVGPWRMEVVD